MLNFSKNATRTELDQFFKLADVNKGYKFKRLVNKAALTKSRKNLSHQVFIDINNQLVDKFYAEATSVKKWRGHRINFASAISKIKNKMIYIIQQATKLHRIVNEVDILIRYIPSTIETVRDNRHHPRRLRNVKNDIHFC